MHRIALLFVVASSVAFAGDKTADQSRKAFHQVVDGINAHDLTVFDKVGAPTLVDHDLPAGTKPGVEGTKAKINAFLTAFPDVKFVFESEIVEGNRVAGRGYFTGTHKGTFNGIPATGKTVKVQFQDQWRFENGKMVEYWGAPDVMGLLTQLGALPQKQM